jgi:phosphoribosyl 1,2-cyclic phosphate phosphodiesterase
MPAIDRGDDGPAALRRTLTEAVVLGCGTSHGVPTVACGCEVCWSTNPRNQRSRSALLIRSGASTVLIDAPPELRLQLVREQVTSIDGVVVTHSHADHIMGMDDLRRFTEVTGRPVSVYAQPSVAEDIRRVFRYAFQPPDQPGGGLPAFDLKEAAPQFTVGDVAIESFEVLHGLLPVLGIRVGGFAYLTDVSEIPPAVEPRLRGLETLILDATRIAPHPSHFHLDRALEVAAELGAGTTYLTHLSHDYDYDRYEALLPERVHLSYDGLRIPISKA